MTDSHAAALYESRLWESLTDVERATWQLHEEQQVMPVDVFEAALARALGRTLHPLETSFNRDGLRRELRERHPAPTLANVAEENRQRTLDFGC